MLESQGMDDFLGLFLVAMAKTSVSGTSHHGQWPTRNDSDMSPKPMQYS